MKIFSLCMAGPFLKWKVSERVQKSAENGRWGVKEGLFEPPNQCIFHAKHFFGGGPWGVGTTVLKESLKRILRNFTKLKVHG